MYLYIPCDIFATTIIRIIITCVGRNSEYLMFIFYVGIFINFYSNAVHKFPVYGTIKLYCIVLCCATGAVLYCIALHCIASHRIASHCIVLYMLALSNLCRIEEVEWTNKCMSSRCTCIQSMFRPPGQQSQRTDMIQICASVGPTINTPTCYYVLFYTTMCECMNL